MGICAIDPEMDFRFANPTAFPKDRETMTRGPKKMTLLLNVGRE
jgi:hypothetical protein